MRNSNNTANDNRVNGGNSMANGTNTNGPTNQNPNITERNRANAQHSTGPRTDEGKAASAQNAVRDRLSIPRHVILKTEDPAAFERLRIELRGIYQPQSDREALAVDDLAQSRWAILRCDRAELKILEDAPPEDPFPDKLNTLFRYRAHWERQHDRALREFRNACTDRQREQRSQISAAIDNHKRRMLSRADRVDRLDHLDRLYRHEDYLRAVTRMEKANGRPPRPIDRPEVE